MPNAPTLGIFARTFKRETLDETLDAAKGFGISSVHFNYACAGLPSLPETIEDSAVEAIRASFADREIEMAAVSATFNAIHPDPEKRSRDIGIGQAIIRSAPALGTRYVTLCTGTRDAENMWRKHPDNGTPEAWNDLVTALERILPVAEECGVTLGVEPETANVIDSARKARRILDEMKSDRLKIVLDGANLFYPETVVRMEEILTKAVDLLGPDLVMAHAKDIVDPGKKSQAAGTGALDYNLYVRLLKDFGFTGPLILHNLDESEIETSLAFVGGHVERHYGKEQTA